MNRSEGLGGLKVSMSFFHIHCSVVTGVCRCACVHAYLLRYMPVCGMCVLQTGSVYIHLTFFT